MAERESPFAEEWRDCLRQHYKHVIKKKDTSTEQTLIPILQYVGFRENELLDLRKQADPNTANKETADSSGHGGNGASDEMTFKVHPAECTCAACIDTVLDDGHDDEGQPLEFPEEPDEGEGNVFQVVTVSEADSDETATDTDSTDEAASDETDSADESPKQRSLF